jgi:hypothetical protein
MRDNNNNKENKMTISEIATKINSASSSAFVRSMMIMDELKKNGLANSPQNNKIVQAELDKLN